VPANRPLCRAAECPRRVGYSEDMPFVRAAALADLPPGAVLEVAIGGEYFALSNAAGTIYAAGAVCPHRGGPLGRGTLQDHHLVCPRHLWEFDCRTGAFGHDGSRSIPVYPAKVEDGHILVGVPGRA
jgi:nitrite reductase/ring-hydroxylating ferredoxin subunit